MLTAILSILYGVSAPATLEEVWAQEHRLEHSYAQRRNDIVTPISYGVIAPALTPISVAPATLEV